MKETDKVLSEALKKAIETAEKTGQFVVDQAPDLIRQFLIWKTVEYSILLLLGLVFFYVAYRIIKWTNKQIADDHYDGWEDYPGSIASVLFLFIFGVFIISASLFPLVKILVAPKIFLIEYAAKLL